MTHQGGQAHPLNGFEVREHVLKFRQVGWRLVPTYRLETFPQVKDRGIVVSPSDGFLRNPLEDFDDGSVRGAHHDRRAFGNQTLGTERREMVANQFKQGFLATGPRLVTCD